MSINAAQAAGAYRQIANIQTPNSTATQDSTQTASTPSVDASGFMDMVGSAMQSAKQSTYAGEQASLKGIAGKIPLHELVNSVTQAELAVNTIVAVRDKVINAYQDIIKMPI